MEESEEDILAPKEPQVTSEILEERIAARALRIQRRQDALRRLEARKKDNILSEGDKSIDLAGYEEEISPVERQAAECAALLEHLLADGEEKVTNVRIASDAREVARRFAEADKKKEILGKLEDEAKLAQEKFEKIMDSWDPILELNDPLEIDEEMTQQKERCHELISQKNAIIQLLKDEMKIVDDAFYKDLQKQIKDIKDLSERIDAQVLLMKDAYQSQLALIESSIEMERAITVEYNEKRWDAMYKKRDKEEMVNLESKIEQISEFEKKMDVLAIEHREKFRASKIQLETDIQVLQQELQHLKATCLINSEKIDYNFQVLKRREEENVFVRSQQKRKLNKMQDIVNGLKKKIKNAQRDGAAEEAKANKEICRLHDVMLDLQVKAEHFAQVNERRYQQLWRMNREKANELLEQIIFIDKEINDKILARQPTEVKINLLKQSDLPSYKAALERIREIGLPKCESETSDVESVAPQDKAYIESKNKLVKHILKLIADSSGFLIEERLWPLLEKYEKEPVLICKLDNIFSALEIQQEEDIEMLCKYFSKYAYCPVCDQNADSKEYAPEEKGTFDDTTFSIRSSLDHGDHSETSMPKPIISKPVVEKGLKITKSEQLLVNEVEEIFKDCNTSQDATGFTLEAKISYDIAEENIKKSSFIATCSVGHDLKISSVHVLNALQECVASVVATDIDNKKPTASKIDTAISRSLKTEDVVLYWNKYKEVFSPQKEKLWDGLLFGLTKYLPILQERQKMNEEVTQLRKQNMELQHLLRGHMPSHEMPKVTMLTPLNKQYKSCTASPNK